MNAFMTKLMLRLYALLRKRFYPYYTVLHDIFAVLRHLWFVFVLLGIGCFAFVATEQGQDMLQAMREFFYSTHKGLWYFVKFSIGLLAWSTITWCASRILLLVLDIHTKTDKGITEWSIRHLPPVLGAVPLFGMAFAFFKLDAAAATIIYAVLGIVAYFTFTRLEKRFAKKNRSFFSSHAQHLGRIASLCVEWGFGLTILLFLLFVFLPVEWDFAEWLQPGTIIVAALAGWMVLGNVLVYVSIRTRLPVFVVLGLYSIICSLWNNNHAIRLTESPVKPVRQEIKPHFKEWLKRRVNLHPGEETIPVVIVASQGGGIRALDWTGSVLDELNHTVPGFSNHIYAISGVSGGSVGGAMYASYLHDKLDDREKLKTLCSSDYLSGITSAMLYPDMFQKVIPFKVGMFDRARFIEDSWSDRYKELFNDRNTLDNGFLSLWNSDDSRYRVPSLFLNSVLAESGQKAIVSNLKLDPRHFQDAIDVIDSIGSDIPVKTAALCSARFPYVTPGGKISMGNGYGGHLIDGGYLENTGTVTAMNLVTLLNAYLLDKADTMDVKQTDKARVAVIMLYVQNDAFSMDKPLPATFMNDLLIPPTGFLGAWDREGLALREQMKQMSIQLDRPMHFIPILLNREPVTEVKLPLSWYLSPGAADEIQRQAGNISKEEEPDNLNYKNYVRLRDLFGVFALEEGASKHF